MGFLEKLLNKSNSYNYYKQGYDKAISDLKKANKKLNKKSKENKQLKKEIQHNNNKYNELISLMASKINQEKSIKDKGLKDLNIAYVLSGFPIHSETFIVSEVKWLVENGYNIIVFSRFEPYKPVPIDFDVENIRFNDEVELMSLLIEHDIDLMHTHFVYPTCTEFTYPIAEKLKIPFTVFAHAYDIFIKENDAINKIDEISQSEYCKAIFTLSDFHKNYLTERNADPDKIVITKQASNYEVIPLQDRTNRIKKIVSISRFVEKKGLDVLIDAAKLLEDDDFEFSIYGFGNLENDLQRQIDELNCTNISINGELPPGEVKNILIESDLLASPCKVAENGDMDGFPTIIFEAMAVGLPFLTTKVSAIPEIVNDGVNGFMIEPDDPQEFARKIREISELSDDELFEIRRKAQEDVKNISSVDKTMEKYIDTIKNYQ